MGMIFYIQAPKLDQRDHSHGMCYDYDLCVGADCGL